MRLKAHSWLVGLLACCTLAAVLSSSAAVAATPEFGIESFVAGTCKDPSCTEPYTQAAGHPPFGVTKFKLNTVGSPGEEAPVEDAKNVRVDLPPGLAVNPEAVRKCSQAAFASVEVVPGSGLFAHSPCPEASPQTTTRVGTNIVRVAFVEGAKLVDKTLVGAVYNLEQPEGLPLEFGIALELGPVGFPGLYAHVYLEGGVSWNTDYHEFFTIKNISTSPPLIESTLITLGDLGNTEPLNGALLTIPSTCDGPLINGFFAESYSGKTDTETFTTPVGVTGCEKVPFEPSIGVTPSTSQSDQPDAATIEVKIPQNPAPGPEAINSSALKDARVTLPAGMTINPSAANGLEACTDAQFGKGTTNPVSCPPGSQVGTVRIETPALPPGSLTGKVYVGQPLSTNPESGQEYRIFIDAEAPRYGQSVRLLGTVSGSATSGQLTTAVLENPPLPSSAFIVTLGGPHVPLANPLVCGAATTVSSLVPYTGNPASADPFSSFVVDANGKGGACPSPLPFALSQSTHAAPTTGGSTTSFTLSLTRGDGNQYLSKVSATLPPGLVARVPSVTQCGEAEATTNKCPAASQIGTATVSAGSGPNPLTLGGTVYFTGPYQGAPFGLMVAVPAQKIGPYDYGTIITRATVGIDSHTARVTVASALPTIVGGVPLRLKNVTITVNRANFMLNPTNCGVLATDTLLTSTFGSTSLVSTPFQASGCDALAFKPRLTASSNGKTSRKNGAALTVRIGYPSGSQANIKSVVTRLPKQLPSRLSTLKLACPEATFDANPSSCPSGAKVGSATAVTPLLPGRLTGPAYFVSHGGAAFPDLDIVMTGANGVRIVLVGNNNISKGITTTTFAAIPDAPVSSFVLKLPAGRFSALAANGNLCAKRLLMPTTITGQNGKVIKQNTRIAVSGCGVRILSHRLRGHRVLVTVQVPSAGRLSGGLHNRNLRAAFRRVRKAGRATVSVPLSLRGLRALARHRPLRVRVRIGFVPTKGGASIAFTTVRFR